MIGGNRERQRDLFIALGNCSACRNRRGVANGKTGAIVTAAMFGWRGNLCARPAREDFGAVRHLRVVR